ncbi:ABC transporter permease [Chloroflexi bacterium TSY]|nr:ABC transporter permease [Chloroflexi bacterium TSY]
MTSESKFTAVEPVQPQSTSSPLALSTSTRVASPWMIFWRQFRRHKLALFGSSLLFVLILIAIFAPFVVQHDPLKADIKNLSSPPSGLHILGTDRAGRDVWARIAFASRVSLSVGIVAVAISISIGTLLGAVSGYYGGWIDIGIQRFTDIVMCFPTLIIIIAIVAIVGPSIYNVMIVIGLLGWTETCRLVRGQFLSLREKEFVEAAICLGLPIRRVIFVHILPNVVAYIIVAATFGVASAILSEASLSFLGMGVQPPTPSWGNMLNASKNLATLTDLPWLWIPPGAMITLSILSINFMGDGLRDALDPRLIQR